MKKISILLLFCASTSLAGELTEVLEKCDYESDCQTLIESQANSSNVNDQEEEYGYSPLHISLQKRFEKISDILLERGANPKLISKDGTTTLISAAYGALNSFVPRLLAMGVDVNAQRTNHGPALAICVANQCSVDSIKVLVSAGADINASGRVDTRFGSYPWPTEWFIAPPLMIAALNDNADIFNFLISAKSNPALKGSFITNSSATILGEEYEKAYVPKSTNISLIGTAIYKRMRSARYPFRQKVDLYKNLGAKFASSDLYFFSKYDAISSDVLDLIRSDAQTLDPNEALFNGYPIGFHLGLYYSCEVLKAWSPDATALQKLYVNSNSLLHIFARLSSTLDDYSDEANCIVDMILQKTPNFSMYKNGDGDTAFHIAVERAISRGGSIYEKEKLLMNRFLRSGFSKNTTDRKDRTVFQLAIELKDKKLAKWIKDFH